MWIMSSEKVGGFIHFYIGQVKVAHIALSMSNSRWKAYLHVEGAKGGQFESVGEAMKEMHRLLRTPRDEIEKDGKRGKVPAEERTQEYE